MTAPCSGRRGRALLSNAVPQHCPAPGQAPSVPAPAESPPQPVGRHKAQRAQPSQGLGQLHRYCSAAPDKKVASAGRPRCSWCPCPGELSQLQVQGKVVPCAERDKCPLSAQSNHLCLAPGSTSCSPGWALAQALQTQGCHRVFRAHGAAVSLSELPLKPGVHLASFPQGGHT